MRQTESGSCSEIQLRFRIDPEAPLTALRRLQEDRIPAAPGDEAQCPRGGEASAEQALILSDNDQNGLLAIPDHRCRDGLQITHGCREGLRTPQRVMRPHRTTLRRAPASSLLGS